MWRAQYEARIALMAPAAAIASAREQTIDGPGGPLRIRIYTPRGTGPFPLLVFFHGSGFVLCSLDTHDGMCRNLCAGSMCVVRMNDESEHEEDRACDCRLEASAGGIGPAEAGGRRVSP